jgi:LEA14-like dessication related protein
MFKWIIRIVLLLAIAGGGYYFIQGLGKASLDRFDLTGISGVGADSFTIDGNLYVKNPSKVPVPVQSVTYDVILVETGETISSGRIPSFVLSPGTSQIPFNERVNWIPTATLATKLVLQDHVYANVKGVLHVDIPQVDQYDIPFQKQVDIKQYVTQFAQNTVPAPVTTPSVTNTAPSSDKSIVDDLPGLA